MGPVLGPFWGPEICAFRKWELFIENIKEFLNPGGVAVIQPSPYVYDKIESFKEELDFLAPYCHPGPMYDAASDHRAFYIVIRK